MPSCIHRVAHFSRSLVETVFNLDSTELEVDILIFLTGRDKDDNASEMMVSRKQLLQDADELASLRRCSSSLTTEQRMHVFKPAPMSRVAWAMTQV